MHQQVTTVVFKDHPNVQITIQRDPQTKAFHCPHCGKRYPIAGNVRVSAAMRIRDSSGDGEQITQEHMLIKCAGYAQYRAASCPKIKIRPSRKSDESESGNATLVEEDPKVEVKAEKEEEAIAPTAEVSSTQESQGTRIVTSAVRPLIMKLWQNPMRVSLKR